MGRIGVRANVCGEVKMFIGATESFELSDDLLKMYE